MANAKIFVDHLDHGGKAVRCATGRRYDIMFARVINVMIDAIHNIGRIAVLNRRRNNNLFDACIEITLNTFRGFKIPRAVDHNIDTLQRQRI